MGSNKALGPAFNKLVAGVVIGNEFQYYIVKHQWWVNIQHSEVVWVDSEEFEAIEDALSILYNG